MDTDRNALEEIRRRKQQQQAQSGAKPQNNISPPDNNDTNLILQMRAENKRKEEAERNRASTNNSNNSVMETEPTPPFHVRAIANFAARSPNEMSIEAGKTYKVIQTDGKGQWWNTQDPVRGTYGWFPANYVEVINPSNVPPPADTPPGPPPGPPSTQNTATHTAETAVANTHINGNPPVPVKTVKDKVTLPTTVNLQIVSAKNLKTDKDICCHIYLCHSLNDKNKDGKLVHKTSVKKSKSPEWNEKFEVSIKDPEMENISVRVVSGGRTKLGEVLFALRATVRSAFTSPNAQYYCHKLGEGEGDISIWLQYNDFRQSSGPSNFQHKAHIGFNSASGTIDFGDVSTLPEEFRKLAESCNF